MLLGLRLASASTVLREAEERYAYCCSACGCVQAPDRSRCYGCGDRRHTHTTRFRRVRVANARETVSALSIAGGKSFARVSDGAILGMAETERDRVVAALRHLQSLYAPGSNGHKRNKRAAKVVYARASNLLDSLGETP